VESDQINIFASTVFRDFEQIQNAQEARLAGQLRSDVWKAYLLNRIDLNLAFLHTVPRADGDARTLPDSNAASDFSATYSLAKSFRERHEQSLRKNFIVG
jgi:hypothetical protein